MKTTIKKVAELANVSIATVSRVINNNGYISTKTRKNVLDAIRKSGYQVPVKKSKPQQQIELLKPYCLIYIILFMQTFLII